MALLADIGGAYDAQPLGVGGHDPVLDPVVDHLDEVARPVRPAVEIPLLGRAVGLLASRSARDVAGAGRQPGEDRIEALDHLRLAPDHHAVPALQPPDAATGPHVDVVDPLRPKLLRAPDVVDVVGVAPVDEDVALL